MAPALREWSEYQAWSEAEGYPVVEIPEAEDCLAASVVWLAYLEGG